MKRSTDDIGEKLQAKKPVFLTKAEREQLALKRRQDEFDEQKRRSEQLLLQNNPNSSSSKPPLSSDDASRHHRSSRDYDRDRDRDRRDRDRDRDRDRERERERERERDSERRNRDRERDEEHKARERARLEKLAEREREKELEAIKEQYLGSKKPKKRVIKPSEKFRFSFDWENTEDTSRDMNILYQNPHEARLLFGRGFRAGMDRREQKKLAAKNEKELRDEIRKKDGIEERPEEAAAQRLKEEAADMYDTFDMRVDRHWSEKKLEEMTERDWRIFREDFNISYKGSKIPRPMRSWVESKLSSELLKAVERAGYKTPSPIQMAAIPLGLQQRDVIGVAETGSGKTAAFVLPMLTYITRLPPISEENEAEGPYAVVMAPTRELAQQIEEETVKFAHYLGIKVVSIVGGQSIEEQGFKIRQGCEVVIATPGRLIDCLERRYAVLNQCNYVVLDEADRMIDMGFEPQVVGVLDAMPSSNFKPENEDEELDEKRIYRTTYMFSATMPPAVERLARKYLRNPVVVTIGTAGKATDLITQHVIMVKESEKMSRLQKLLDELVDKTAIVFINTKKSADFVSKTLEKSGYRVTTLHGGKSQEQREISLEGFRTKRFNVLVATDVAGRGIDIPDVAHVINYDMPGNIEMYTHRIGRTGRAGKTGIATTFLTLHDTDVFYDLKQMLTQSNSPVPPELARHEASKFKPGSIPDRPPRRNDTVFAH
ncbi:DEAD-box ATP-dependent RNA helicase 21 [Cynara cardunculus var. scolymus]|uniref:DEAD-box ATP-dependent RNA helicase 21 n=1 Tax=Cynara cardunculus var. scolymus TaxID=59895 RepID=A0A124SD40_CYNCS|nr:DEAD-box ATP-dependent RNA helicase 21 [Cynara cardunculus var. scolymus]XP_024995031.1 DEAD-box ATP-dependent RNA helicase 21 [Cynara cardunculus var. scolymus]KVH95742.1 DNA/RNA helicase, DEAD/DEAH box type, N-terminal [Cynara cardunculus var. scolymus]